MSETAKPTFKEAFNKALNALNPFMNDEERKAFDLEAPEAPEGEAEKKEFVEANLADGTVVNIEPGLELGATVEVVTEEGVVVAEDGAHTLDTGVVITTEGGVIIEINEEAAPEGDEEEAPAEEEMAAEENTEDKAAEPQEDEESPAEFTAEQYEDLVGRVTAMEAEITTLKEQLTQEQAMNKAIKDSQIALAGGVQKLSSTIIEEPVQPVKTPFNNAETKEEKLNRLQQVAHGLAKVHEQE